MAEESLKFKVRFRLENNNSIQRVEYKIAHVLQSFVKKFGGIQCSVEPSKAECMLQDLTYREKVYEMSIKYLFKDLENKKVLGAAFEKVCILWCSRQEKINSQWLIPIVMDYYHKKTAFHHDVEVSEFAFGTLPDMCHFVQHYHCDQNKGNVLCSFYHNQKHFDLFIALNHKNCDNKKNSQKINVQYDSVVRVHVIDVKDSDFIDVFFQLNCFPFFYAERVVQQKNRVYANDKLSSTPDESSDKDYQRWERALNIGCCCNNSQSSVKKLGRLPVLKIVIKGKYRARRLIERLMHRCSNETEFCFGYIQTISLKPHLKETEILSFLNERTNERSKTHDEELQSFSCQYSWQLLFSRTLEIQDQIDLKYSAQENIIIDHWGFLKNDLLRYAQQNHHALCNALCHINDFLIRNVIFTFLVALKELFIHYCTYDELDVNNLPNGMCLVRRIIITPSRTILLPPTEMFDNRIIREFPEAKEYMIRVSIQDDNFSKLTFAVQYHSQKELFMDRVVGDILKRGLCIGTRCYEVLASSNSQLREHGIWLYARDSSNRTAGTIRQWMGDFSHIKNVAKYMARMGQCFSTSDEAVQISVDDINVKCIPDVEIRTTYGAYTFSDGIGKISSELAEEIRLAKEENNNHETIHKRESIYKPSAFQIRYKGCKGMLAEDPSLHGRLLAIRPSMEKFKCDTSTKLEIVKISAPRSLFLNRPLITILEQLKVKADVFLDLQNKMILELIDSLIYEDKATSFLEQNLSNLRIPYQQLRESGICFTEEPFFRSLLITLYRNSVDKLRTKSRIAVPHQYGRNMLGVLDETKTLNYGEVFIQYSEELGLNVSKTHILEGTVVVTKNPCMHPGDVRKLKAIDVPALHHIKDCIVFPANGHRPHPDEMAGSDLDGDEYVVIWMPELIFPSENFAPMNYPASEELEHSSVIGVNEMVQFLCEYIQNDNIGTLAYAHLAWADYLREGIFSRLCMDIAKKYPYVLDFAKTGKTQYLSRDEKPKFYPDFMEKGSRSNSYRSTKALGLLYRFIRNLEACVDKPDLTCYSVKCDSFLEYPGWERYLEAADQHRKQYMKAIIAVLNKHGMSSEAEALCGIALKSVTTRFKLQELDNIALVVKSYVLHTMTKYRYIFLNELEREALDEGLSSEEKKKRRYQKASAWYMVTYQLTSASILSFAWTVSDILAEVRREVQRIRNESPVVPFKSSLLKALDDTLHTNFCRLDIYFECPCITIFQNLIREWMMTCKLSLSMVAAGMACMDCFRRIFEHFMQNSNTQCCSWLGDGCNCSNFCSPSKIIMDFMKFYLSRVASLGRCASKCDGFQDFNLQALALQTYTNLAVTRSSKHLGLLVSEDTIPVHDDSNEEGDPVRISVSEDLREFMENYLEQMKKVLRDMTGVKDVQITIETQGQDTHYILVNSTGTRWQRWALDDIIMDPKLTELLRSKLMPSHS